MKRICNRYAGRVSVTDLFVSNSRDTDVVKHSRYTGYRLECNELLNVWDI